MPEPSPLHVTANEREVVRVFTFPADDAADTVPLGAMLGADPLDMAHVESFHSRDLAGVGLPGYLTDGLGIDPADIADDLARLKAADGQIVILHSKAFCGVTQTLAPVPPLTHLGTYRLIPPEIAAPLPPAIGSGTIPAARVAPGTGAGAPRLAGAAMLSLVVVAAVVVLAAIWLLGGFAP
ncbi:MAG: hypothetical protein LJE68_14455 [Rhodobacter sp.]|nr:hypothetical protein [Rhodobacter sp.]